ncbi:MAG: UDP-N-acetylmuramyl-tripeptide synthetase [Candidatus Pacebacteria bacterium]|nr:UDP-N-acetylmuramyl-tripeptide synthetase [Candidatus Paceibacterota bacterium]
MLDRILRTIAKFIPKRLFAAGQPIYHYLLALSAATIFNFPSRDIKVVAVTGTKGKSTSVELVNAILEAAGYKTAVLGTVRFKIGEISWANKFKMTVPGRFFVQKFLRDAVNAGCQWAVIEMSSEAVKQSRHRFIDFDALIFTNLAPEHIESHGSYEQYREEKLKLARAVTASSKKNVFIVANADDKEGFRFLDIATAKGGVPPTAVSGVRGIPYRMSDVGNYETTLEGSQFAFKNHTVHLGIPGTFNIMNALGAATFADAVGIPLETIAKGLSSVSAVRGRVEYVREGQPFHVVVDYAHTPESLEALYELFKETHSICVLGNTGGGRDTWKRPVMAGIAEKYCNEIILTNEDPYDEDPRAILAQMEEGVEDKQKLSVILDRREAIHEAIKRAEKRNASDQPRSVSVLITGKGTDPYIMGANGAKMPWDDATVAREEIKKIQESAVLP